MLGTSLITPIRTTDPIYPLTVEQYHSMIESGALTPDDPVELVEGVLVFKMPKNPPHILANRRLAKLLAKILPPATHIRLQDPITIKNGEPEPDIAVIVGSDEDYGKRHPMPGEILMVAEVAESTLSEDRSSKKRGYARSAIPIYWIVNLVDRQIEVFTNPNPDSNDPDYTLRQVYDVNASIEVVIGSESIGKIAVSDILP